MGSFPLVVQNEEYGRILLRLERDGWIAVVFRDFKAFDGSFPTPGPYVIFATDLDTEWFQEGVRFLLARSPDMPWVLIAPLTPATVQHVVHARPPEFVALGHDEHRLPKVLHELHVGQRVRFFFSTLFVEHPVNPILRAGVLDACHWSKPRQRPPEPTEGRLLDWDTPSLTVSALAAKLGCSESFLYRAASTSQLSLSRVLRWVTFLKMIRARERGLTWTEIAHAFGFTGIAGVSNYCVRLTGRSLAQVQEVSPSKWEEPQAKLG